MFTEICENPNILKVIYFIQTLINIALTVIPILIIVFIIIDLFKNNIQNNDNESKKNLSQAIKRVIYLTIIFLVPSIVNVTMSLINYLFDENWTSCIENANMSEIEKYQKIYDEQEAIEKEEKESEREYLSMPKTEMKPINFSNNQNSNNTIPTDSFQGVAKTLWQKIVTGNHESFTYSTTSYEATHIPLTGTQCNCSSYVSWVLYEYGLNEFKGTQKRTKFFYNDDWEKYYGWTVIKFGKGEDITNLVKSGDIVVRTPLDKAGKAKPGHVAIIAEAKGNATTAYDCGKTENVEKDKYPNGRPEKWFLGSKHDGKDNNPGKIIRVTTKPVNNRR